MEQRTVIGVDLGGTKVVAGLISDNQLVDTSYKLISANSNNSKDIVDELIAVIDDLFNDEVVSIGVGIPGLVNRDEGVVNDVQNIPSWKEIPLKAILENYFSIPVFLDNDANCFALGEAHFGTGRGETDFVGITLGTGMGSGIIKNGFLLPDAHGGSGEFGNIPYLDATYEDYCSGKFFKSKYGLKGEEVALLAEQGDEMALKAFGEFGKHLGNAIKTIKMAVDPEKVIIGGSVARAANYFEISMWKELLDFPFPGAMKNFEVVFSSIENIAVMGAASLYLNHNKLLELVKHDFKNN
ncbi:MAG: ROK family protein [Bacteroidetes bacterium]|nr:MAG: ROK family protein [Bacteroidota bacterium]